MDAVSKAAFTNGADAGAAFFATVDNVLTPAMVDRDPVKVIAAVRSLGDNFSVQQVFISRSLDLVQTRVTAREASTDHFVSSVLLLLAASVGGLLLLCFAVAFMVRRSIVRPILALSSQARRVADMDLPNAVHQIQSLPADAELPTIKPFSTETHDELADLSMSFNSVQNAALDLASEQAVARRIVSENLVNIARRTQTLLGRSLTSLSDMEQSERDPQTLENLFHLDHLSTRMRRNAQSLLVLAGAEQNRLWSVPLPIGDVVRAAVSEIENYGRVDLGDLGAGAVQGALAPEVAHLLAELLENATTFSPPSSKVMVVGRSFPDGHQIAIVDYGIGMSLPDLDEANAALRRHSDFVKSSSRMLGFQVVARIADKHGIDVLLAQTAGATGVTAIIRLPQNVLDNRNVNTSDRTFQLPEPPVGELPRHQPLPPPDPAVRSDSELPTPVFVGEPSGVTVVDRCVVTDEELWAMVATPEPVTVEAVGSQPLAAPEPAVAQSAVAQSAVAQSAVAQAAGAQAVQTEPVLTEPRAAVELSVVGLPKRVRGAQLPDLGVAAEPEAVYERPAEQVRNTLSSLQRGVERGRQHTPE
jgi:hypothetical protein